MHEQTIEVRQGRPGAWRKQLIAGVALAAVLAGWPVSAHAQHGNYLLGSLGLLGGAQPPEGIYYQNLFSYYNASGSFALDASRARTIQALGQQFNLTLNANLKLRGSLDAYVDQNIIGMTTPLKILGANYGFLVDIPFAEVQGSGAGTLDLGADLRGIFGRNPSTGASLSTNRTSTASFNIFDMYIEPINLGWHWSQLDVMTSFGFFAPTGDYNSARAINNGLGRWGEMFGLGAVAYLDAARTWSVSAMTRYLTHQSQEGVDVRVGDDVALEWGLGKTFRPASWQPWVAQLDMGVVGYAQWQVTDNRGSAIPLPLRGIKSNIYGVGPEIAATTKFGRFFARYEFEFGADNTPQGQVFHFGVALLIDPFSK